MRRRCQRRIVSGVQRVATPARSLRPRFLPFAPEPFLHARELDPAARAGPRRDGAPPRPPPPRARRPVRPKNRCFPPGVAVTVHVQKTAPGFFPHSGRAAERFSSTAIYPACSALTVPALTGTTKRAEHAG